jgi:MinD-like ATPase involved in chromosome partitioning or flagellar assembly
VDTADLLAASASGLAGVALIGADCPRLDADVMARVLDSGLSVICLVDRGDEATATRMLEWGAHVVVEIDPQELGRGIGDAVSAIHVHAELDFRSPQQEHPQLDAALSDREAQLICVWGPAGAPGRTSIAVGIADACAGAGLETLLIDADTWAPSIALTLGLADDGVGLASACRRALNGALDTRSFHSVLRPLGDRLTVLSGIGRADRWTEVRRSALLTVLARARSAADVVVIDCAAPLESDEELLFDTTAPRRNAAAFVSLEQATDIVVVGSADPVGLVRLVNGLSELADLKPRGRMHVVANRVRESMLGRNPNESVADVLSRHAGLDEVWCVPQDSAAFDHALREGCTLRELGYNSPARQAIGALTAAVTGQRSTARRSA